MLHLREIIKWRNCFTGNRMDSGMGGAESALSVIPGGKEGVTLEKREIF